MTVSSFCLSIFDGRVERERELDRNELLPVQNCQINTALMSRNIVCIAYFTNLFFFKKDGNTPSAGKGDSRDNVFKYSGL